LKLFKFEKFWLTFYLCLKFSEKIFFQIIEIDPFEDCIEKAIDLSLLQLKKEGSRKILFSNSFFLKLAKILNDGLMKNHEISQSEILLASLLRVKNWVFVVFFSSLLKKKNFQIVFRDLSYQENARNLLKRLGILPLISHRLRLRN